MDIRLQPKQWQLYDLLVSTGDQAATIIGYGGAKGGAKSHGADSCALLLAAKLGNEYRNITLTIIRRVSKDLQDNHIDKIFDHYPELRAKYTKEGGILLKNGSNIVFRHAETPGDVERKFRGGYESAFIFVDEAQQFTERELQDIQMASRWTKQSTGLPRNFCKTILLFNPGGVGSEYIRRVFWLKEYVGEEEARSFKFIHAFGWDNFEWFRGQVNIAESDFYDMESKCDAEPFDRGSCDCCRFHMFIYRTSEGRKYNAFPESIREGLLLGNFDHFENQYFAGVWNERKCVLSTTQVQAIVKPWWVRWMAQDWGFGDHDCHLWAVTGKLSPSEWMQHFGGHTDSSMDIVVIYRELVQSDRAEADLAMDIVKHSVTPQGQREKLDRFFLSQDAFGQRGKQSQHSVGMILADVMRENDLPPPEPAVQERVNGWRFVHHCLHQANLVGCNFDAERARQGPAVFVSAECVEVIQAMPMAVRDAKNPEDVMRVAGVLWEDVTDAVRYLLMSMLGVLWEAPVEVRRKEVYDTYNAPAEERTGAQMTTLALQMRKFDATERTRFKRMRRR